MAESYKNKTHVLPFWLDRCCRFEVEFEEEFVGKRRVEVGWDVVEAEFAVDRNCVGHFVGEGVETHLAVAGDAGGGDQVFDEAAAELMAAASGANVESLHFADVVGERTHGDYADGSSTLGRFHPRDEESAARRSVFAGETSNFLFETLKAKIGIDGSLVFAEEGAGGFEVLGR